MKIKRISNNEVVVFLTNGDLELFDLSPESFEPRSTELHKFLFVLMETVREETGFDPYDGQVVVEAARTKDGVHLSISKTGRAAGLGPSVKSGRITKEDFNRAEGVRVKSVSKGNTVRENSGDIDLRQRRAYKTMFEDERHGQLRRRKTSKRHDGAFVFVFSAYTDLEAALCITDRGDIAGGELYRSGKRYAMILRIPSLDRCWSMLEFTESYCRSDMAAHRVRECWSPVAKGIKLSEMADAVRDMI